MVYLKLFNTDSERTACTETQEYVSYTEETDKVHIHYHDYSQDYLTLVIKSAGTIQYSANTQYDGSYDNSLSYSQNDADWTSKQNNFTIQVAVGDIVKFKGNGGLTYSTMGYTGPLGIGRFSGSTASFDVEGNITSLIFGDNFSTDDTNVDWGTFDSLFAETNIINAKNLVVTSNLGNRSQNSFNRIFANCNSLLTSPKLIQVSSITNCYSGMFADANILPDVSSYDFSKPYSMAGLYRLTKVTDNDLRRILPINPQTNNYYLPAMSLSVFGCYISMFYGCTLLTTAPELPATTLTSNCYSYMFYGCTSLTTAPKLPATTLNSYCYSYMFDGCTSLVTVPQLSATTLDSYCYSYMFQGCTSLATAPELLATTLASNCYRSMFSGCTSLTNAPELLATTLQPSCYYDMFNGCTSLVTAPQLQATTLANYCCSGMFTNCTSLTTAPDLLATRLVSSCYENMFSGCTNLNYIKMLATSINSSSLLNWVVGVAASGTFVKAAEMTTLPSGVNGIPEGWTVQDA